MQNIIHTSLQCDLKRNNFVYILLEIEWKNNIHPNYNSRDSILFLTNDRLIFFSEICMQ